MAAALTNVTIDDSSSLIVYDPPDAWAHPSGSDAQDYMNATYHGTSVSGASAKFSFNGTGVWFYGAKKPDYGSFILLVDDTVSAFSNATAPEAATEQLLGGMSGLQMGEHVVSIMNGGTGPIDLDSIAFETLDQEQRVAAAPTTTDDPATNSPPTSSTDASSQTPSPQSTDRISTRPNALTDSGDDNANPAPSPTTATTPDNSQSSSTAANGAQPTGQSAGLKDPLVASTSEPQHGLPMGAIVGIAIGCAVVLLIVLALALILFRRRRRRKALRRKTAQLPSPVLPLQDPDTEFGYFFRGQGEVSEKRQQYLGQAWRSPGGARMSSDSGATLQGFYGGPFKEKEVTEMPTPLPPVFVRDSSYTAETATLHGVSDDDYDIADVYARMDRAPPVRPPRPPELRLSV